MTADLDFGDRYSYLCLIRTENSRRQHDQGPRGDERPRADVAVTAPNGSGHDRQRPLRTEPIVHGATEEQAQ